MPLERPGPSVDRALRQQAVTIYRMGRVRIIANPANDLEFTRRAEELAESSSTPEELERELRAEHSHARVVRGVTDIVERWYAYRDGSWTPSD